MNFKIPWVNKIIIYQDQIDIEYVEKFLLNSISWKLTDFSFVHRSCWENIFNCLIFLKDIFPNVSKCILINNFEINSFQFYSLVKAAKNVETLMTLNCKLITDSELDFGEMKGCNIRVLNLGGWGGKSYSFFGKKNYTDLSI